MVASAVASSLRLGWLRIQVVGAVAGVALLVGACSLGAVAEPTIVGQLDRWVYADQSDEAADAGRRDGPGDACACGGRVGALTRR